MNEYHKIIADSLNQIINKEIIKEKNLDFIINTILLNEKNKNLKIKSLFKFLNILIKTKKYKKSLHICFIIQTLINKEDKINFWTVNYNLSLIYYNLNKIDESYNLIKNINEEIYLEYKKEFNSEIIEILLNSYILIKNLNKLNKIQESKINYRGLKICENIKNLNKKKYFIDKFSSKISFFVNKKSIIKKVKINKNYSNYIVNDLNIKNNKKISNSFFKKLKNNLDSKNKYNSKSLNLNKSILKKKTEKNNDKKKQLVFNDIKINIPHESWSTFSDYKFNENKNRTDFEF